MKSRDTITRLLSPQIPPHYLSLHNIFHPDRQISPSLYRGKFSRGNEYKLSLSPSDFAYSQMVMIDPKGHGSFVKGPTLFIMTDGLVVSSAASTSIISIFTRMKIPVSDIEEHEVVIGMEEALSILKASLVSTCALTVGLKPFMKRQPKQEK